MISTTEVGRALQKSLGTSLAVDSDFAETVADSLRSYASYRDSFTDLSRRVEEAIFNALYERLGSRMTLQLENGVTHRVLMSDLPMLADEAMLPFFLSLDQTRPNYLKLHDWWMETGSPSAMRALYERFDAFLPPEEILMMQQVARENSL